MKRLGDFMIIAMTVFVIALFWLGVVHAALGNTVEAGVTWTAAGVFLRVIQEEEKA